jgi:hypothetical protein
MGLERGRLLSVLNRRDMKASCRSHVKDCLSSLFVKLEESVTHIKQISRTSEI